MVQYMILILYLIYVHRIHKETCNEKNFPKQSDEDLDLDLPSTVVLKCSSKTLQISSCSAKWTAAQSRRQAMK